MNQLKVSDIGRVCTVKGQIAIVESFATQGGRCKVVVGHIDGRQSVTYAQNIVWKDAMR